MSAINETWDASAAVHGAAPEGGMGDYIDALKDDCGLIIGGILAVVEKVTGRDLLEELLKPIAGDFNTIASMQAGWRQVGVATRSVGENWDALSSQLPPVWEGRAQVSASGTLLKVGAAHARQAEAADLVADQMEHMLEVSHATAELVCAVLEFIDSVVQEIIADLVSGPIGLAKGAVTAPGKVRKVVSLINRGLDAIQGLIKAVKAAITAMKLLNALIDGANTVLGVINGASHTVAGRHTGDTAVAGF